MLMFLFFRQIYEIILQGTLKVLVYDREGAVTDCSYTEIYSYRSGVYTTKELANIIGMDRAFTSRSQETAEAQVL